MPIFNDHCNNSYERIFLEDKTFYDMSSPAALHIVVTDINHHVRDFLGRELAKEGYAVVGVKSAQSATEKIFSSHPVDLIILDPEMFPCLDQLFIEAIIAQRPSLQIIIHTYADSIPALSPDPHIHIVEKNGQSIGTIKSIIDTWISGILEIL